MSIFEEIMEERKKQDVKWGVQDHTPWYWMTILMEEVGEAAQAICGKYHDFVNFRKELIQVGAVVVAIIENYDRVNETKDYVEINKLNTDCSGLHKMHKDKDALCPHCGEPFDLNF